MAVPAGHREARHVLREVTNQMGRDADVTDAGMGLRRPDVGLALGAAHRLPDVHDALGEIEVAAAQPTNLRLAATPTRQQHRQAMARRQLQQPSEFGR